MPPTLSVFRPFLLTHFFPMDLHPPPCLSFPLFPQAPDAHSPSLWVEDCSSQVLFRRLLQSPSISFPFSGSHSSAIPILCNFVWATSGFKLMFIYKKYLLSHGTDEGALKSIELGQLMFISGGNRRKTRFDWDFKAKNLSLVSDTWASQQQQYQKSHVECFLLLNLFLSSFCAFFILWKKVYVL